jgi:hypothetical protein
VAEQGRHDGSQIEEIRRWLTGGGNERRGPGQMARGSPFIVSRSTGQNGGRDAAGCMGTGRHPWGGQ